MRADRNVRPTFKYNATLVQNRRFRIISDRIWRPLLSGRRRPWLHPVVATRDTSALRPKAICPLSRHDPPVSGARASRPRISSNRRISTSKTRSFASIRYRIWNDGAKTPSIRRRGQGCPRSRERQSHRSQDRRRMVGADIPVCSRS